jgi:hypothetical protein
VSVWFHHGKNSFSILCGAKSALHAPFGLGRMGGDPLDIELFQGASNLCRRQWHTIFAG